MLEYLFYVFAAVAIFSAVLVITSAHPVRAVLSLVMTFVGAAGVWLLANAEFLGLALIVVYVGAVMVLFLFVVMMLDVDVAELKASWVKFWPLALVAGGSIIVFLWFAVGPDIFGIQAVKPPPGQPSDYSNIKVLGLALYTAHVYPFECAGVILLAAMIAAIALTFRGRKLGVKGVAPADQIAVQPGDRLRMVQMPSAKPSQGSAATDGQGDEA